VLVADLKDPRPTPRLAARQLRPRSAAARIHRRNSPRFIRQNLFHMIRFAEAWPDQAQAATLAEQLGWSHFKEILYLENELARQFYAEMCRVERWSQAPLLSGTAADRA
jgi:hypothetical protein